MLRVVSVVVAALGASQTAAVAQDDMRVEIKLRVEQLRATGSLVIAGQTVHHSSALPALYEARSFAPLWSELRLANDLLRAIRGAAVDGLDPANYHLAALEALAAAPPSPATTADLDVLRSDALLRLAHDLLYGRLAPDVVSAARIQPRPADRLELGDRVRRILTSGRIADGVAELRPTHFTYRGLVAALADLRRIADRGGWERIPEGPTLRLGSVDPRVPALRRRLALSGDLPSSDVAGNGGPEAGGFDLRLETALKRFQHRHALNEDGVLGPATLAELNVSVKMRIKQVRVNLERARWFTHELPQSFVAVNIAGAMVYLVREGEVVFETRAVVGKPYTRTPIFQASLRYLDLNPTWTVPPGIVREVLGELRRDPTYLRRMNMRVLDRSGRRVDVPAATLSRYSAADFPYVFRQEPGPLNPLGEIKFVFPNPYNVYLHDTPAKGLFEQEARTFSHGCIRVQDPLRLAELILDDPVRWSRAALEAAIAPGTTRTITLETPLPVRVLYWTASADLHGELHFYRDVYSRDAAVLRALQTR